MKYILTLLGLFLICASCSKDDNDTTNATQKCFTCQVININASGTFQPAIRKDTCIGDLTADSPWFPYPAVGWTCEVK
jgi:hypothetical protein